MTNQYQQNSINLQGKSPTTFFIRSISDLDSVAPADPSTGARVITTESGQPGIELIFEGQIQLPDGQFIVDDAARGKEQGVLFRGRSASLDGISGNISGALIRGTNGCQIRTLTITNSNPSGFCIECSDLISDVMSDIPDFRFTTIENCVINAENGGIRFFTPGFPPDGSTTVGILVQNVVFDCKSVCMRFENLFNAGIRINGILNLGGYVGLEILQFAASPPAEFSPLAIRDSTFFADSEGPGDIKCIVFDDVSVTQDSFAIVNCGFSVSDAADAIYDNATAAAVVPGVGTAANLVSIGNVILGLGAPILIAQNPV